MYSMTSNSVRMLERSLDFLWAKQAAHLDNISNAETPGYKVKTVTFEESFASKLRAAAAGEQPVSNVRRVIEQAGWRVEERRQRAGTDAGSHPDRLPDSIYHAVHLR